MPEHSEECIEYNEKYESDIPPNFRECICDEEEIQNKKEDNNG